MKSKAKKVVSVALALVMLVSLCLSAPLTVSAATVQVTVNNSGSIYTVAATVGQQLPSPTDRVNGMKFLGWYSDPACTVEYGTVKANETRKAYALYPSTYIGFEGKSNYVKGTDYRDNGSASGVVTDPTDANNKVFKLHADDIWANVTMPQYDDNNSGRYMLQSNHSYTFTFKFMIPGGSSVDSLKIRMNKGDLPTGGNGRTPFGQKEYKQSELTPNTWYTYTTTYDVGDTTKQTSPQLVALWDLGTNYNTDYVYLDDVIITDNDSEFDSGSDVDVTGTDTFTSFEGCTVIYNSLFSSTTHASISREQAYSGSSSLKIAPTGANTYRSYAYNSANSAIKLNSYTKYTVSYYYMATSLAGSSTNVHLTLNGNVNVWGSNAQLNKTNISGSALNKWHKVEVQVVTGDCSNDGYLTFGLQTSATGTVVYFDDVNVTPVEYIGMHDYYCDFSADFSHYKSGVYYASDVKFNTNNNILYFPTTHTTKPSTASGVYVQHFAPYNGVSYYQFEANVPYKITVRYKQTASDSSATGYFSIGSKKSMPGSEPITSLVINSLTGTTDWKEYTFEFVSPASVTTNKYLTLTFGTSSGTVGFEVDYIKVTKGPFINNNGEIYLNNTPAGSEIATPTYDTSKYNFIGWYSDPECTIPFGTVREKETRTAYARYNKTIITFGEASFTNKYTYRDDSESYSGYESKVVLDPDNATNKVFKLHNPNIWSNFVVPIYDTANTKGYSMIAGVEYTVSVDFKIPSTVTADKITMRILGGTGSKQGVRTTVYTTSTTKNYSVSTLTVGKWYTYSATFTANSNVTEYPYIIISFEMSHADGVSNAVRGAANYLYFDNVTVRNDLEVEEVSLNNRGVISTVETIVDAQLPAINSTLDEQVFLGWYADPECTVPFGTVQQNETRTAYAKYDTVKVTFGNEHKQLNAGETFTVPCYDGVENALTLKANTTYAMRFVLKPLKDSAEGKVSVLGNEFNFDAYTAEKATSWTPASITFTATEDTALQMAVISDGDASVLVDDILVYELDYTLATSVTAGKSTITATKPVAKNNKQTGTVSINLANGEQLKANGLTVTYDIYATAFSEPVTTKAILPASENGTDFTYIVPASAKNIAVSAEFIDAAESNISITAASIREKSANYTSGIRFRGRVYNNDNIKEVGFLLAPEALIAEAGETTLTLENAEAVKAWKAVSNGVVYEETALYKDYQVILSNIDELLDINIRCVMFVEYNDGTVEYAEAKTQSHTGVKAIMTKVYRGITSYYNEEYEDTLKKLLQTQNDGTFSFLSLTDIHIDYVKTVADGEYWYTTPVGGQLPDRYNIQREIAMVVEMANTTDVDCIILGGDLIHGTQSHSSAMSDLNYIAQVFQKAKVPVIASRGNHDHNDYHGDICALEHIINNAEWSTTLINPLAKDTIIVHDENDQYSPYYYMDFPEKKTRVIVLDSWNYPIITNDGYNSVYTAQHGWSNYGDVEQMEWLAKVALDATNDGWNYVLSTHAPIIGTDSASGVYMKDIIRAFNNKTSVTVNGQIVDYSNCSGQIPLNISGHTHVQSWRVFDNQVVCVNTASGRLAYYPDLKLNDTATQKDFQPVRYEGTYSEACFDAVVYNPTTNTVERFNFGNRPDDKFVITENGVTITETPHETADNTR